MNAVIEQTVQFKGVSAAELFQIFVDRKRHSDIHDGAETHISDIEGESFSLLNGNLRGKNLLVVPSRMIVQSWRGTVWKEHDLDSILTMTFHDIKGGAKIYLIHGCTPTQFREAWDIVYWEPIRRFLKNSSLWGAP